MTTPRNARRRLGERADNASRQHRVNRGPVGGFASTALMSVVRGPRRRSFPRGRPPLPDLVLTVRRSSVTTGDARSCSANQAAKSGGFIETVRCRVTGDYWTRGVPPGAKQLSPLVRHVDHLVLVMSLVHPDLKPPESTATSRPARPACGLTWADLFCLNKADHSWTRLRFPNPLFGRTQLLSGSRCSSECWLRARGVELPSSDSLRDRAKRCFRFEWRRQQIVHYEPLQPGWGPAVRELIYVTEGPAHHDEPRRLLRLDGGGWVVDTPVIPNSSTVDQILPEGSKVLSDFRSSFAVVAPPRLYAHPRRAVLPSAGPSRLSHCPAAYFRLPGHVHQRVGRTGNDAHL